MDKTFLRFAQRVADMNERQLKWDRRYIELDVEVGVSWGHSMGFEG